MNNVLLNKELLNQVCKLEIQNDYLNDRISYLEKENSLLSDQIEKIKNILNVQDDFHYEDY